MQFQIAVADSASDGQKISELHKLLTAIMIAGEANRQEDVNRGFSWYGSRQTAKLEDQWFRVEDEKNLETVAKILQEKVGVTLTLDRNTVSGFTVTNADLYKPVAEKIQKKIERMNPQGSTQSPDTTKVARPR